MPSLASSNVGRWTRTSSYMCRHMIWFQFCRLSSCLKFNWTGWWWKIANYHLFLSLAQIDFYGRTILICFVLWEDRSKLYWINKLICILNLKIKHFKLRCEIRDVTFQEISWFQKILLSLAYFHEILLWELCTKE